MTPEQNALFNKANRALETALINVKNDDADAALNRAYYATYYAATAALLQKGETPRTHRGVHTRFQLHFTARLEPHLQDLWERSFNPRQRADYDTLSVFDVKGTSDLLHEVSLFLDAVKSLLG